MEGEEEGTVNPKKPLLAQPHDVIFLCNVYKRLLETAHLL
jgi:hypothetical protein